MSSLTKQSGLSERIQSQINPAYEQSRIAIQHVQDLIDEMGTIIPSAHGDIDKLSELYDAFCQITELSEEMKSIITCAQAYASVREKLEVRS